MNGHHISTDLVSFFNIFYRSIENYCTKTAKNKPVLLGHSPQEIKKINSMLSTSYEYNSLKDTKIDSIYYKLKENNFEIIRNSFFLAEEDISKKDYDIKLSGSTCILIFVLGNRLISANCGDSRSILIEKNSNIEEISTLTNINIGNNTMNIDTNKIINNSNKTQMNLTSKNLINFLCLNFYFIIKIRISQAI